MPSIAIQIIEVWHIDLDNPALEYSEDPKTSDFKPELCLSASEIRKHGSLQSVETDYPEEL